MAGDDDVGVTSLQASSPHAIILFRACESRTAAHQVVEVRRCSGWIVWRRLIQADADDDLKGKPGFLCESELVPQNDATKQTHRGEENVGEDFSDWETESEAVASDSGKNCSHSLAVYWLAV